MKWKSTPYKVLLHVKLLKLLKELYPQEKTNSARIHKALNEYNGYTFPKKIPEDFAIYQVLTDTDFDNPLEEISLRLADDVLGDIKKQIKSHKVSCTTISWIINIRIAHILYFFLGTCKITSKGNSVSQGELDETNQEDYKSPAIAKPLLRVHGNKFNPKMQFAIYLIKTTANANWMTSVETCCGGLGIHLNFDFATVSVINDDDHDKMNLYRAIKSSHQDLLCLMRDLPVSKQKFIEIRKTWNQKKSIDRSHDIDLEAAAMFLYLNLLSVRNDGTTYDKNVTQEQYDKALLNINFIHDKLKTVKLSEKDIFNVIKKYINREKTLFIIDPPYLDSQGYSTRTVRSEKEQGKGFEWPEHVKLAKTIQQIRKKGNDFIYFCRITYRDASLSPEEIREWNRYMEGRIGTLYRNNSFYYIDVVIDKNITERIITSFPFKGAVPYGK